MLRHAPLLLLLFAIGCAAKTVPPAVTIAPLPATAPQASVAPPEPQPPKVPPGYVRVTIAGVVPQSQGAAVALLDPTEATVVPIYVGGTEAASIQQRFEHTSSVRPLTHDLFDAMLREIGAQVVRAQVDKLENGTYFGTLILKTKGRYVELDARPSDAIALALGSDAPIYCAADVIANAGIPRDELDGLDAAPTPASVAPKAAGTNGAQPSECLLARALRQAHRPEWKQAAALCKARGGTP